jgi:hypothetical protein
MTMKNPISARPVFLLLPIKVLLEGLSENLMAGKTTAL